MGDEQSPGNTYHCICTTLILATCYDLSSLPTRAEPAIDAASILPIRDAQGSNEQFSQLHNISTDRKRVVVRREDGFEKRTLLRCLRCKLVVGYKVDDAQSESEKSNTDDFVFVLPGGLVSTKQMMEGQTPARPDWARKEA